MIEIDDADAPPGQSLHAPRRLEAPLVLNSPHSGRAYPRAFLDQSRLEPLALRRSEDAFVDQLFAPCVAHGAPLLAATFPRAFIDVNREPFELDPHMFSDRLPTYVNTRSLRVAGGLGTIPRLVSDAQPIYRAPMTSAEALDRIERWYRPYHTQLTGLVDRSLVAFGVCLLLDCHSMPSSAVEGGHADFVVGDRFGASAAPFLSDSLILALSRRGYIVRRNKPYAGGFITEHYGEPAKGRHAIQIEVNRAIYLDERRIEKLPAMAKLTEDLFDVIGELGRAVASIGRTSALAAE